MTNPDNLIECPLCEALFKKSESFLKHARETHQETAKGDIGDQLSSSNEDEEKVTLIKKEPCAAKGATSEGTPMTRTCELCGLNSFPGKQSLKKHMIRVHPDTGAHVNCRHCGKSFSSNKLVLAHIALVHLAAHRTPCPEQDCGKILSCKAAAAKHVQEVHTGAPPVTCNLCQKQYTSERGLDAHVKAVHKKPPDGFRCPVCGEGFPRKVKMKHHAKGCTGRSSLMCPHCMKEYANVNSLRQHVREIHEDRKGAECRLCERVYSTKRSLDAHMANVHEKKQEVECVECERKFANKYSLRGHMQNVHHI